MTKIDETYKKILTIQDISCVGQCSLTVALPIISACGVETSVLPSAVLSTHTGGFSGWTFCDLTEDFEKILAHWVSEGIFFDGFYTGYLGSVRQIELVKKFFKETGNPGAPKIIDPAMADHGKLYAGFDLDYVSAMKGLVSFSDVLLPNITEASFLTDIEYQTDYDEAYIQKLLNGLEKLGSKNIVLTGVSYEESTTGVIVYSEGKISYYRHKKIPRNSHGTGDVYASAFVGAYLRGKSLFEAAKIAADYTVASIEATTDFSSHWYGVKFERAIPKLIADLYA